MTARRSKSPTSAFTGGVNSAQTISVTGSPSFQSSRGTESVPDTFVSHLNIQPGQGGVR